MTTRGRPEKLTDELKTYITRIKLHSPKKTMKEIKRDVRNYLFEKMKDENKKLKEMEILRFIDSDDGPVPGESAISKYLTPVKKNIEEVAALDNPWNTAILDKFPVDNGAIPFLIMIQVVRGKTISKPFSIRDAKWFGRLYSFSPILRVPGDLKNNADLDLTYRLSILATWAEIYARREKINFVSGITEPDNSIFDVLVLERRYMDIFSENFNRNSENVKVPEELLTDRIFMNVERIMYWESLYLDYSLGSPALTEKSTILYFHLLTSTHGEMGIPDRIRLLSHSFKRHFFIRLRQWAKDHPDYDPDSDLRPIVSNILEIVTKIDKKQKTG